MWTILIMAGLPLLACSAQVSSTTEGAGPTAQLAHIGGSEQSGVKLTERAMQRVDIATSAVRKELVPVRQPATSLADGFSGLVARKIVPYSSLIYDPQGGTWVYANTGPRTFVRHQVVVYDITGEQALLEEGPAVGTEVVTLGAAEIYGTELALQD